MGKYLNDPMELRVVFSAQSTPVEVELSAHYTMACDHGLEMSRGVPIDLTPAQETAIKNFTREVILPTIKQNEGIP